MTASQKEKVWKERYENYVEVMTNYYEEVNRASPVITYKVNDENELKRIQNERLDDSWIRI